MMLFLLRNGRIRFAVNIADFDSIYKLLGSINDFREMPITISDFGAFACSPRSFLPSETILSLCTLRAAVVAVVAA
jgi:hypothetical protein